MNIYPPGTRIGRYEIAGRPLMGGMGIVYLCLDHQEDRPVALKTLRPEYLPDRADRDRFLRRCDHLRRQGGSSKGETKYLTLSSPAPIWLPTRPPPAVRWGCADGDPSPACDRPGQPDHQARRGGGRPGRGRVG